MLSATGVIVNDCNIRARFVDGAHCVTHDKEFAMSLHHAASGELLHLDPAARLSEFSSIALIKTDLLEVIRMTMPTGKKLPEHQVPGPITLQCLTGCIELSAHGRAIQLRANDLVYLAGGEPHALLALENSAALLTILLHAA